MDGGIQITEWASNYETAETRKLVRLRWVPLPNGMGRGYAKLMHRHGFKGLGVWAALLEIASRKHRDKRDGSLDYTLDDLALESRGDLRDLQEVLPTLQEIGWIGPFVARTGGSAGIAGDSADEGKGMEGKGKTPLTPRKRGDPLLRRFKRGGSPPDGHSSWDTFFGQLAMSQNTSAEKARERWISERESA